MYNGILCSGNLVQFPLLNETKIYTLSCLDFRKRTFFKTITILVPRQWSEIEIDGIAINETHDKSDVVIDHPEPGQDHTPFTVKQRHAETSDITRD